MSETWHLNQQQEKKIHSFENTCLRTILNINWTQRVKKDTIRQKVQLPLITDVIRQRRWCFLGQVIRIGSNHLPNSPLFWQPEESRRRGRPRNTQRSLYKRGLSKIHASLQPEWEDVLAAAYIRDD